MNGRDGPVVRDFVEPVVVQTKDHHIVRRAELRRPIGHGVQHGLELGW
jgi:hypothetical protein